MHISKLPFNPSPDLSDYAVLIKYSELHSQFGRKKNIHPAFDLPIIMALSFYPELKHIAINFESVSSDIPLHTKPRGSTIWHDAFKRTYIVSIATQIKTGREDVLLSNLTFNMQVGVIAHELAHIVDYLNKSFWEVAATGLLYKNHTYKAKLEHKIDTITVQHGLGYQLIEYGNHINALQKKFPSDNYFQTYFNYYLKPAYIKQLIKVLPVYN